MRPMPRSCGRGAGRRRAHRRGQTHVRCALHRRRTTPRGAVGRVGHLAGARRHRHLERPRREGLWTLGTLLAPGQGEVLLERSVNMVSEYAPGDLVTVEAASGRRTVLRVAGLVHDINAFPAHFVAGPTGYVSMDTLRCSMSPMASTASGGSRGFTQPGRGEPTRDRHPRRCPHLPRSARTEDERARAGKPLPRRHLPRGIAAAARPWRAQPLPLRFPRGDNGAGDHGTAGEPGRDHEGDRRAGRSGDVDVPVMVTVYGLLAVVVGCP
jgi:hypothetical protein